MSHLVSYTYVIYHIIVLFVTAMQNKNNVVVNKSMNFFLRPLQKHDANHPKQKWVLRHLLILSLKTSCLYTWLKANSFTIFSVCLTLNILYKAEHLSKTLLQNQYNRLKAVVIEHLTTVTTLSLTIDFWSNCQMHSYLGIGNWKLEHIVLGCNRVQGRYTAENIQFWYEMK